MLDLVLAVGLFMSSRNSCGETCSVSAEACCRMEGGLVVSIGTFSGFLVPEAGWVEPGPRGVFVGAWVSF